MHTGKFISLIMSCILAFATLCTPAKGISLQEFEEMFPGAKKEGACYIFRLEDCHVVAARNPYGTTIALIFFSSDKKSSALKTANKLARELGSGYSVSPFFGGEPSAVILCPSSFGSSNRSPIGALLSPEASIQFLGWQGRLLKARVEYTPTSSLRKKNKGWIDMTVDLTQTDTECIEFRPSKGRMEEYDVKSFISSRMWGSAYSLPDFTPREKSELRADYPSHDIIAYSRSSDFCIVAKGKTYRAGSLSGVKSAIRSKQPIAKFDFPDDVLPWPDKDREAPNKAIASADSSSSADSAASGSSSAFGSTEKPSASPQKPDASTQSAGGSHHSAMGTAITMRKKERKIEPVALPPEGTCFPQNVHDASLSAYIEKLKKL